MPLTDIIASSLTLSERLRLSHLKTGQTQRDSSRALQRWEKTFKQYGSTNFDSYLSALSPDQEALNSILDDFHPSETPHLPRWTGQLSLLATCFAKIPEPHSSTPRAYANLFRSLYDPLLQHLSPKTRDTLPPSTLQGLFGSLVKRLVQSCKMTFNTLFTDYQSQQASSERPLEAIQDKFLKSLRDGLFLEILQSHPALFRATALATEQWIHHLEHFSERFVSDRKALKTHFFSSEEPLQIAEIRWPLSDFHHHGGAAMLITFESGHRIVYKQRSLAIDRALKQCLLETSIPPTSWIEAIPNVLDRETYGWAEYLPTDPVSAGQPADIDCSELGDLLAVAQQFGATDLHLENIGVQNRIPIPWDLETFLRPQFPVGQSSPRHHPDWRTALQSFESSVMGVGLICPTERGRSIGVVLRREQEWNDLEAGYRRRLERSQSRATPDLSPLAEIPIRYIHRPTSFYHNILEQAWHPNLLKNGVDWEIALDTMLGLKDPLDPLETWINHAERQALTRLDIPAFWVKAKDQLLKEAPSGDGFDLNQLQDWTAGYQVALERWQTLPKTSEQQCRFIHFLRDDATTTLSEETTPWPAATNLKPTELQTAIEHFSRTAETFFLDERRLSAGMSQSGSWRLAPATPGFYQGSTGLALFWGAASKVMTKPDWAELAKRTIEPLLHDLNDPVRTTRLTAYLGFGGATGIPSVLYCLGLLNQFLPDPTLGNAQEAILKMDFEHFIAGDRVHDIIGGSAGAILCWLASYRRLGMEEALHWAEQAGQHLLKNHPAPKKESSRDMQPLAGVSHGASGFALALARLAVATQKNEYLDEAKAWLTYEDQHFLPDSGHWRDLREKDKPDRAPPVCAWCNGGAGIALARQTITQETGLANQHIQASITATLKYPVQNYQHTCCGNFGRLEILHTLAQDLKQSDWEQTARQRAAHLLQQNQENFHWRAGRNEDNLGFFTGISGIGYTLLRLIHPEAVPCALRWD